MGALSFASWFVNRSDGCSDIGSLRESIMNVIGYGRCSTAEQASNGLSIKVQRRAVERVAASNGWDLTWLAQRR